MTHRSLEELKQMAYELYEELKEEAARDYNARTDRVFVFTMGKAAGVVFALVKALEDLELQPTVSDPGQ